MSARPALPAPRKVTIVALVIAMSWLLAAACDDDDSPPPPTEPPATVTATSEPSRTPGEATAPPTFTPTRTPTTTATPRPGAGRVLTLPNGVRTGVASVDRVIEGVERGGGDALLELVAWEAVPCASEPDALEPSPACPEGTADGTEVEVLPVACGTLRYFARDDARDQLAALSAASQGLYRVVHGEGTDGFGITQPGGYGIVFAVDAALRPAVGFNDVPAVDADAVVDGAVIGVTDAGITGVLLGCGAAPGDLPLRDVRDLVRPVAAPVYAQPPGERTGEAVIDALLDAVADRDVEAVVAQFAPLSVPCALEPASEDGGPPPPACREDEADGTPVDVIVVAGCEISYQRADEYQPLFVAQLAGLYGVLHVREPEPPPGGPGWPVPTYEALYLNPEGGTTTPWAIAFGLSDEGVISVIASCDNTLAGLLPDDPEWRMAPVEAPAVLPKGVRTGVESLDAVLAAVEALDTGAILDLLSPREVPCSVDPSGGIPQPPLCREGEADGTPVPVILGIHCEGSYIRTDEVDFGLLETARGVWGIARSDGDIGPYQIVYLTDPAGPRGAMAHSVWVDDLGITAHGGGCGLLIEGSVPDDAGWLLAPVQ